MQLMSGDLGRAILWDDPATTAAGLAEWFGTQADLAHAAAWLRAVADALVIPP